MLLEALRLGAADEAAAAAEALLGRATDAACAGLVASFPKLPTDIRQSLVARVNDLGSAASRCARGTNEHARVGAADFVAAARSPKLVYILGDLLRGRTPSSVEPAAAAVRRLCEGLDADADIELRDALEPVIAAALNEGRGAASVSSKAADDLTRAAILILANGGGDTVGELMRRSGGRGDALLSRMAKPTDYATASACVVAASLVPRARSSFVEAFAFAHTRDAIDGFLSQTGLLNQPSLVAALAEADRGKWLTLAGIRQELAERAECLDLARTAADVACWVCKTKAPAGDLLELIPPLVDASADDVTARVTIFHAVLTREHARGEATPIMLLDRFAGDSDARLSRAAIRQIARRAARTTGGPDVAAAENILLRRCATADALTRNAAARGLSAMFDSLWRRYQSMPAPQRVVAARAMCKLLPDAAERIRQRAKSDSPSERLLALRFISEVGLATSMAETVLDGCADADTKVRSKAALLLSEVIENHPTQAAQSRLDELLEDVDPRVRANAVETLEHVGGAFASDGVTQLLEGRSRLGRNRERANAIVAMSHLKLLDVETQLFDMLRDGRDSHRLSALWAVEQTGRWRLLNEVVRIARGDKNLGVRRSALSATRRIALKMRTAAAIGATFLLPTLASASADERLQQVFAGVSGDGVSTSTSSSAGLVLAAIVMLLTGGIATALIAGKLRKFMRSRASSDAAINRSARKLLSLRPSDVRRLRKLAASIDVRHAATLLLCPSLLKQLRARCTAGDRELIDTILVRLAV